MTPTEMDHESLKRVASLCRDIPFGKLLSGAAYGAEANIYRPPTIADMELSSPQCLLLALLNSSVSGDVTACLLLAHICHKVEKLRLRHYRVWLLEEFTFPRSDIEKAMVLLADLVAEGILKLPPSVMGIMTSLANKYGITGVQLRALSEEGRCDLAIQLETAVGNNSPRDIFDLVSEGADVNRSTQSGGSLLHLAAIAGNSASITALGILKANLEAINSRNATPLEEAVRNNRASSVKALLMAGAKCDKLLFGGDTYLHIAAAGVHNAALEALLQGGMCVNQKNHAGETPLIQAVKADNIRGVNMLLEKGADFNALLDVRLKDGDSIVHSLARSGNIEILKILKDRKHTANIKNQNGLTPLHVARNSAVVRILLRMGVDVDTQDNRGKTPLMNAAGNSKTDIVSSLLLNRADPNIKDKDGLTPLHYAVKSGYVGSVTTLLFAGARVDDQDNKGETPAFVAAINNKLTILQLLVERADLTLRDSNGDGILLRSARSGHAEVVKVLLDAGVVVDIKGQNQNTALHSAAQEGHTAVVTALLDGGAVVDMKDQNQSTALHWAAQKGHTAVVKALLDGGAVVDMEDQNHSTALHRAARHGHTAVVTMLLVYGAMVDVKDLYQNTALHRAARIGHTAVVTVLLEAGAAVDMKGQEQRTALHLAANQGHIAVVTVLLNAGVAVDMKDQYQSTALHLAAKRGHPAVVKALLDAKAAVDMKGQEQRTALHLAANEGRIAVVTVLLNAGVAVDMKDQYQTTALHLAAKRGHPAVVKALLDAKAAVDVKDKNQFTVLHYAAEGGLTAEVKALLVRGAYPAAKADGGYTPLMLASIGGHLAVAQLLVDRGVPVNDRTNDGRTAFGFANSNNRRSVADYLRSKGGVQ